MNLEPRLDILASALADRSRCRIVWALMDGRAHTAKELAFRADATPQTASFHLQHLLGADVIACHRQGRHRYYFIERPEIADAIEAMALAAPAEHLKALPQRAADELRFARSCWNHLAGRLGVALADRMTALGMFTSDVDEPRPSSAGMDKLAAIGLDVAAIERGRRPAVRRCLDWTERRFHLAGSVGVMLLEHMLAHDWLVRRDQTRGLMVTDHGEVALRDHFGLEIAEIGGRPD